MLVFQRHLLFSPWSLNCCPPCCQIFSHRPTPAFSVSTANSLPGNKWDLRSPPRFFFFCPLLFHFPQLIPAGEVNYLRRMRWRVRNMAADQLTGNSQSLWAEITSTVHTPQALLTAGTQKQTSTHTKAHCLLDWWPSFFYRFSLSLWEY